MKKLFLLFQCVLIFAVIGCKNDGTTNTNDEGKVPAVAQGAFVLNEGDYGGQTKATLTVHNLLDGRTYQNAYESANGNASLGVLGDDMVFFRGKAYVVMSVSENIVVVDLNTYQKVAEASFPLTTPHDILIDSTRNLIFVTRLYRNSIQVLDLNTLALVDTIPVGLNPQGMVLSGNKLFVCNSGYGDDNTVSVVNLSTMNVAATITVSDGPYSAAATPDGRLWVACTGRSFGTVTPGKVFVLDPASNAVVDSVVFSDNLTGAMTVGSDGYVYVIGGAFEGPVHRISIASKQVALNFISGSFYGLGFDQVARELYVADAKAFVQTGEVRVYTEAGALRTTFAAGKGPSTIRFRR